VDRWRVKEWSQSSVAPTGRRRRRRCRRRIGLGSIDQPAASPHRTAPRRARPPSLPGSRAPSPGAGPASRASVP